MAQAFSLLQRIPSHMASHSVESPHEPLGCAYVAQFDCLNALRRTTWLRLRHKSPHFRSQATRRLLAVAKHYPFSQRLKYSSGAIFLESSYSSSVLCDDALCNGSVATISH
jgi:hypothetical protein